MSIALIPSTLNLLYVSKFLGKEKTKPVMIGSLIFLIVQVSGIVLLEGNYGIFGAGIALVIANCVQTIYFFIMNRLIFK